MGLLSVKNTIYFYIFICAALLVFNVWYILRSGQVKRRQERCRRVWMERLHRAFEQPGSWDEKRACRRLKKTPELTAFFSALEQAAEERPEDARAFAAANRPLFRELAAAYGKRPAMERAFFAYVIAAVYPPVGDGQDTLLAQLLEYLKDSTVYSRENVLSALYALGSTAAVEHAFEQLSEQGWYHDPRLLADGLAGFQGDKTALAEKLWSHCASWEECLQVGIVRFADSLPDNTLAPALLSALENEPRPTETRFTLVRYFGRHAVPEAKPVLLRLLAEQLQEGNLAIAAAAALAAYPGEDTLAALEAALYSRNWFVRRNAARALQQLGISREEVLRIEAGDDRYASEMLRYATGYAEEKKTEAVAAV